jgi:cytochrome c-type biogenesis protein CcmH
MSVAGPSQDAKCTAARAAGSGAHGARRLALRLLIATIALAPLAAGAADAVPTEKDAVAASRAVKLSEKLRCLVCQNQTIADSNAELAQDLRRQIHEQIAAGRSDSEIVDYMVARYGDFVLYQPPVKPTTVLLWAGPALLLLLGCLGLVRILRMRRAQGEAPPLTAEERERAERLLAGDPRKDLS